MTRLVLEIPSKNVLNALLPLLKMLRVRYSKLEVSPIKNDAKLEDALRVVRQGCDMSNFGDALEFQKSLRKDRVLPYRD